MRKFLIPVLFFLFLFFATFTSAATPTPTLIRLPTIGPTTTSAPQTCVQPAGICLPIGGYSSGTPQSPCCGAPDYVCTPLDSTNPDAGNACIAKSSGCRCKVANDNCATTDDCAVGLFCTNGKCKALDPVIPSALEDVDKLIKDLECGKIGQKCCPSKLKLIKPRLQVGDQWGPVSAAVNYVLNGLNGILDKVSAPVMTKQEEMINGALFIPACAEGSGDKGQDEPGCTCGISNALPTGRLCNGIPNPEYSKCQTCSEHGVWTAIRCVDFNLQNFIAHELFGFGVGLAGIIALLCIIYSAFLLQTSAGNPEKLKKAQEMLTSCIIGLLLILFSAFILRVIGVNILRIPGFS